MNLKNLWLLVASTAVAFVAGIAIVSYWMVPNPQLEFRGGNFLAFDPEIGMVATPSHYTKRVDGPTPNRGPLIYDIYTDDRSARVDGPEKQKSPEHVDMLAIGCSFTFGHPIQNRDTYSSRLARDLGVTVSDFALPSYGTTESLLMLRRNRDLAPKVVIYGFITAHLDRNILACASSYHPFCLDVAHVDWDEAGRPGIVPPTSNGVQRVYQHMTGPSLNPVTWLSHGVDVIYGKLLLAKDNDHALSREKREEAFAFLFAELQRTVKEMGAELLVVHIPQTYEAPPPELMHHLNGARFLDVAPALKRHHDAGGAALQVVDDGHPNEVAHGIIASEIAGYLRREGLAVPGTAK
ncbi:MAG TPA: hypothetical protein VMI56_04435 [Reyranella sp.]|nr:hypothetical protein [Reyranella sp.]